MTEQAIRELIEARRLTLTQQGKTYRVTGFGVDLRTTDLRTITPEQLKPYQRRKGRLW